MCRCSCMQRPVVSSKCLPPSLSIYWDGSLIYPGARQLSRGAIHQAPQILLSLQCFLYGCWGCEYRFFCLPSTSLTEPSPQPQVNISYIRHVGTAGPEGRQHTMKNVMSKGCLLTAWAFSWGGGSQKYSQFWTPPGWLSALPWLVTIPRCVGYQKQHTGPFNTAHTVLIKINLVKEFITLVMWTLELTCTWK